MSLTLPPVVGKKYYYVQTNADGSVSKRRICQITKEDRGGTHVVYRSRVFKLNHMDWIYDTDGKAYTDRLSGAYVAKLVEDADPKNEGLEELRSKRKEMMEKLKELNA